MTGDYIAIEITISVDKNSSVGGDPEPILPNHPDFFRFLAGKEHVTDRIIIMGDVRIHVIGALSANCSGYFFNLFYGDFQEQDKKEIAIQGVDPSDFMHLLSIIQPEYPFQKIDGKF